MTPRHAPVNPGGPRFAPADAIDFEEDESPRGDRPEAPPTAAGVFLAEAAGLAARRAAVVAELWARAGGPFDPNEVYARADLQKVDAELASLADGPRLALAVADLAGQVAELQCAVAAGGRV